MVTECSYTVVRNERIRGNICELMSEMLDNPDENGIYPTSRFMWQMETFILDELRGSELLAALREIAEHPDGVSQEHHSEYGGGRASGHQAAAKIARAAMAKFSGEAHGMQPSRNVPNERGDE